jgi:prolyl-tRNA synthetase
LIGIPHRIVLSERGLGVQQFEYKGRRDQKSKDIALAELTPLLERLDSDQCDASV